ncbi:murein hydrolase activator EnvC [Vibrio sp. PP-XX7]
MTCFLRTILHFLFHPFVYSATQQELQGVKTEIARQQNSLTKQSEKLDALQSELKDQELDISSFEKQIAATQSQLKTSNQKISQLEDNIKRLETKKNQQSERLKQLLQTYYMTHSNSAEYLFRDDTDEDRVSQYYQYLAQTRSDVIQALKQTTQQLYQHQSQLQKEQDQIKSLLAQQTQKYTNLKKVQRNRQATVTQIKSSISNNENYLAELQRNESRLKAEIAKAAKRRNIPPMNGFARQKGKLPWPLKGQILHRFGSSQTGQVKWKGIVISATYGQTVKAVYSGTVVFSEYLRGYGLVVLLDHGKGDMTLYGFNQTLLKKEGAKVIAGEPIALAGDTGGQSRPALYFEIRRNSRADNPLRWLSK